MAVWDAAYINDLPDKCFLYIEEGGTKDAEGKTKPRRLRHFPFRDADGKIDLPHLRNALARIPQANLPDEVKRSCIAKARRILNAARAQGGMEEAVRPSAEGLHESLSGGLPELQNDVLKDCVLIRAGMNAAGTHYYTPEFLETLVDVSEGALSFLNHPTQSERRERPERGLEHLAAHVSNVRYDATQAALIGDITLIKNVTPAEHARALFADPVVRETAGLSINYPYEVDAKFVSMGGRTVTVPTRLAGPPGAKPFYDFVTVPGAGGRV